ncbi:MAG: DUF2341 domain-containing protein [Bacteroidota bacterium]|nr:DUF2341 domain-containing protein [Bacteroidota bacterium]
MLNTIRISVFSFVVFLIAIINNCYGQTVSITAPTTGSSYTIGSSIAVAANAGAPFLGYVSNVVFTLSTVTVTDGSSPYSASLPTSGLAPGTYTLTATNNSFTVLILPVSASASISVTLTLATPTISGAGAGCGAGSVTLTASSGANPTGGTFNWYNAASGGSVMGTGSTFKPIVSGTYYVAYTYGAFTSARASATVTINPIVATPLSSMSFAYPFNAGSTADISGNGNTATLKFTGASVANPSTSADRYSTATSAYTFDGVGQYITTATNYSFAQSSVFTLSLWFKTTTTSGGKLIGFENQLGGGGQFDRHIYMNNSGQLYFGMYNGGTFTINSANSYNDGVWHHVVVTVGASNGSIMYVDGTSVASSAAMNLPENDSGYWIIGGGQLSGWPSTHTSNYFAGQIDDIGVYSNEQTAAQVAASNDLNLNGGGPACIGSSITLNAQTITGATYTWTDPSGTITATGQNATFSSATTGVYSLTVTGGPGGCSSTASVTPVTTSKPIATFTATYVSSIATTSTITNTGVNPAGYTYTWTITGGTPTTASGSAPFTVTWAAAGGGTVSLTVTSPTTGCSTTSTQIFNEANYAYSLPLTINAGNTTALSNFPYLVSITDPLIAISATTCGNKVQYPNGTEYDFDFTDANGVELPYDIESYNKSTGTLLAWVTIPTLAASGNTTINLLFGSVTAPAHNAAFHKATWPSDYQAVYHFNEAAYTGTVTDGTSNGHTGTNVGMTAADLVTGKIGNAYSFNGSSKSIAANPVNITGSFTISAWVKLGALFLDQKIMTNQSSAAYLSGGYKLGVFSTNLPEAESGVPSTRGKTPTAPSLTSGTWYYVQGVLNGTTLSVYVNGAQYSINSSGTSPFSVSNFYIGVGEGGNQLYFNGLIDEPRVSNVSKTADWLLTEYNNQNSPTSFISKGTLATNVTNAELIYGGMLFTTTNGTTFTINGTATTGTPLYNGKENFAVTGGTFSLSATSSIYGLTVTSPGVCNTNGQTINVGCNIANTGTINNTAATASTLIFNGTTAAQTYTGNTSTSAAQFGNLTINNSAGGTVTITGGPVSMTNVLALTKGNLVIDNAGSGALTLNANTVTPLLYAQIDAITPGYTISGNINYQVYFTGGAGYRNYRSMAAPVYNNTSGVYSATNGTYSLASLISTFIITGSGGSTNGFDKSTNNGATLRTYNFASNTYSFITSLSSSPTLASGTPFFMYFRGSRTPAGTTTAADPFGSKTNKTLGGGSYATADAVTYTYTGVPNQGNSALPAFAATDSRFYFVANPYAATLDANLVIGAALVSGTTYFINTKTWIWSPSAANYAIYNFTTPGLSTNGAKQYIVPGQGFFVQAATTGTVKTLTLTESMKSVTNNLNAVRFLYQAQPIAAVDMPIFRLKFVKDSVLSDEIAVGFSDSAKATIDKNDATHLEGSNLTLSSFTADNQYLAIDVRPFTGNKTTMQLYITPEKDTTYTLKLSYKNALINNYKISLKDSLLNTITDITDSAYTFSVASGQANTYAKRFKLIVEALPAPVLFTKFTGKLNELKKVLLNWNGGTDRINITYQVQRSTNRNTFTNLGQPLTGDLNIDYQTMDNSPAIGMNYYRLVQTDAFNNTVYSDTIAIANNPGLLNGIAKNGFVLYPNAVSDIVSVVGDKTYPGTVKFRIYDNLGKMQASQSFTGMNAQVPIQTDVRNLKKGVYTARIDNNSNEIVVIKFIKK